MATKKSSKPADLTTQILAGIRSDMNAQAEALRQVAEAIRAEIAQVSERLDRLERRQSDADVRVMTEFTENARSNAALIDLVKTLGAEQREVKAIVSDIRDDRARMNALEARIQRLESKAS